MNNSVDTEKQERLQWAESQLRRAKKDVRGYDRVVGKQCTQINFTPLNYPMG